MAAHQLNRPLADLLAELRQSDWWPLLGPWADSANGRSLIEKVDARVRAGTVVYPAQVFRALVLTPRARVRVLILGQDPYHGPDQAEGLAFSVQEGQSCPPSLRNILKEIRRDLGLPAQAKGATSLVPWATQGVLLLNASLTVEQGEAGSHSRLGWHVLTDAICQDLMGSEQPTVFMLWGNHAQSRQPFCVGQAPGRHLILRSNHPSPLSALRPPLPFMGCAHFSQANQWLHQRGLSPIRWESAFE